MKRVLGEELLRMGCQKPAIIHKPLPKYALADQDYGMTIGVAATRGGRIFVCWVGGGDNSKAYFLLAHSDDGGETFSEPILAIDPHDDALGVDRCTIVGTLWTDPDGRLWLFFNQTLGHFDGAGSNWCIRCDDPDGFPLVWTEPAYVSPGCTLNKPVVLSTGEWLLPVSLWARYHISEPFSDCHHELDPIRMANVYASSDGGETWARRGGVVFPDTCFDEHMLIELRDHRLWMLGRTRTHGLLETFSADRGASWTPPEPAVPQSVSARFHLRRLASGRLLLIKHGRKLEAAAPGRCEMTAFLSGDDGRTWSPGLMLDERAEVSYPDSDQLPDGTIIVTFDRNRAVDGEILLCKLREEDILAGEIVSPGGVLRHVAIQPGKLIR